MPTILNVIRTVLGKGPVAPASAAQAVVDGAAAATEQQPVAVASTTDKPEGQQS